MIIYEEIPIKSVDFKTHLEVLWDKASPFYKRYKNAREIIRDIKNSNKAVSLYRLFVDYPALEYISIPDVSAKASQVRLHCFEDKNEVEGVIVKALLEVLKGFEEV